MGFRGEDHTGKHYNRLTGVCFAWKQGRNIVWLWRCDDGNLVFARPAHVKRGRIKSCGCLNREQARARQE